MRLQNLENARPMTAAEVERWGRGEEDGVNRSVEERCSDVQRFDVVTTTASVALSFVRRCDLLTRQLNDDERAAAEQSALGCRFELDRCANRRNTFRTHET
jgi:hypothetical protein